MAELETTAQRFDRDWAHVRDDRFERGVAHQDEERWTREYVDAATGKAAASSLIASVLEG